jgi:hypothetical protein
VLSPAGKIAAPIAPVALINVLRDTSVMRSPPLMLLILAHSRLLTGHRRPEGYDGVNDLSRPGPSEFA